MRAPPSGTIRCWGDAEGRGIAARERFTAISAEVSHCARQGVTAGSGAGDRSTVASPRVDGEQPPLGGFASASQNPAVVKPTAEAKVSDALAWT